MNKKIKAIVITLLLTLGLVNVYAAAAGGGHSHIATKQKVETNAYKALVKYVNDGKLVNSWKTVKRVASNRVGKDWEIIFLNSQIEDKNKQKLAFYMTSYGKFKGANFKK